MEAPKERKPFTVIEALSTDKARVAGHVKWFDKVKGYGFITIDGDEPKDYFVHKTQLYTEDKYPRHPILNNKEAVEFVIGQSEQGPIAEEVSLPEGKIIPGPFFYRRNFRRFNRRFVKKNEDGTEAKPGEKKPRRYRRRNFRRNNRKPAEEKPTEEKPTEEKPTEEKPTEGEVKTEAKPKRKFFKRRNFRRNNRKPAEQKPVEGEKVEEKPAEVVEEKPAAPAAL